MDFMLLKSISYLIKKKLVTIENLSLFNFNCSSFILIRFPLYTATKRLSLWGVFGVK